MGRMTRIAARVAASNDVVIDLFPRFVRCTVDIPMGENDLKVFMQELAVAESKVRRRAMWIADELRKIGHRGKVLNVMIDPKLAMVNVLVSHALLGEEEKQEFMKLVYGG